MPERIDPDRIYTVVANERIADADGWPSLRKGRDRQRLGTEVDALVQQVARLRTVG